MEIERAGSVRGAPTRAWRNVLTGEELRAGGDGLDAAQVFATLPVALLERVE